jgi:hypothetical protein
MKWTENRTGNSRNFSALILDWMGRRIELLIKALREYQLDSFITVLLLLLRLMNDEGSQRQITKIDKEQRKGRWGIR